MIIFSLFFFSGRGVVLKHGLFNEISQGKIFDFIIEDFRFVCLQTEMHFFSVCVRVCSFRDCKILWCGIRINPHSHLIRIHTYQVWKRTRSLFLSGLWSLYRGPVFICTEKEPWLLHTHEHEQSVKIALIFQGAQMR